MPAYNHTFALGGCALLLLGILQFILLPAWDYKEAMNNEVHRKQKALRRVNSLSSEYSNLIQQRKELSKEGNQQQGTLFALVEKITRDLTINSNIDAIRPKRNNVESNLIQEILTVRFKRLYQRSLIKFLYTLEHDVEGITVKELIIARTKNNLLDVNVTLSMTTSTQ